MNRIIQFFLRGYADEMLYVRKKTELLVKSSLTCLFLLLPIIIAHIINQSHWLLITACVVFIVLLVASLHLVRIKKFELAANAIILSVSLLIILVGLTVDYLNGVHYDYTRCLETAVMFLTAIIFVALFAYRSYQIVLLVVMGIGALVAHYILMVNGLGDGVHTVRSLIFIATNVIFLLIGGIIAGYMLSMYRELIYMVDMEAQKVKQYNQDLEGEVAARTHELQLQNEELQKLNRELDRFVYSVSHDLRAPLASARMLVTLCQDEKFADKRSQYLDMMQISLSKLDGFIQDVLHLARNSRSNVEKSEIRFRDMIESILQEYAFLENADKIEKIVRIEQELPFFSDEKRLNIVLNNLISNSIRYAAPHRREAFIEIRVKATDGQATIEIHDNGQGIGEEHVEKVFDMFYRATSEKSGSGLGLYIVKETVQKLNGTVRLTSRLGEGTSFFLSIPALN